MRLSVVRGAPPYRVPRPALAAGLLIAFLGVSAAVLPLTSIEGGPVACPFKAVTGLPCPTCGLVRSTHLVLRGRLADALALNPLDTLFLLVVVPAAAVLWTANRRAGLALTISLSTGERRVAWLALIAAVAANWIYVLATQT